MRMLSSWPQYLATSDRDGVQIHQYATAEIRAVTTAGVVRLGTETDYPWQGRTTVTVVETPDRPWSLSMRVPGWAGTACVREVDADEQIVPGGSAWSSGTRQWRTGDTLVLDVELPARVTAPHARVDAVRGCVALERGPLVYSIESVDLQPGVELEDVVLDPSVQPVETPRPDVAESVVGLIARTAGPDGSEFLAVPYFAWANRSADAMRVWIPSRDGRSPVDAPTEDGR
jgi:DUF1680 family protein